MYHRAVAQPNSVKIQTGSLPVPDQSPGRTLHNDPSRLSGVYELSLAARDVHEFLDIENTGLTDYLPILHAR